MAETKSIAEKISSLTEHASTQQLDEEKRLDALNAARNLVAALESPAERIIQDVVLNPPILMALRMGVQLSIFSKVSQNPEQGVSCDGISESSGASPILIAQILRVLAAARYLRQENEQYKPSDLTMVMADPDMEATTRACFDIGNVCTMKAPEFFRKNGNKFPNSVMDTPFQLGFNTDLSYFAWLGQNPDLASDFQKWMTMKQRASPNWVDWFDIQGRIIEGAEIQSPSNVLLVDVGGGEGSYVKQFQERFPGASGRLILQDLPNVISSIETLSDKVELIPHDFFTPQPIRGARTYFMHWILHDWSDEDCQSILTHIVDAMEPGYSRLIIHENILRDTDCDIPSACMSVMMMVQVAALERSEKQWRQLLSSVGLQNIKFHQPPGAGEGIIEAIK